MNTEKKQDEAAFTQARVQALEKELHLKQLQINRLLNITQAINENVKVEGLYKMYSSFLSWEMSIRKMAMYVRQDESWHCATWFGIPEAVTMIDVSASLSQFNRTMALKQQEKHPFFREFDIVIPVMHKERAIAYTFLGGLDGDQDDYNKIQLITMVSNIIAVAIENKRLFKRQMDQERLKREVELASEIQRMLVPHALPKTEAYEFGSIYLPQYGVGGDYFDCVVRPDNKIIFCIGDISGKGMSAAMLMANFQASLRGLIYETDDLKLFIKRLNHLLYLATQGERYITFFIAELDLSVYRLRYINAGHTPPWLVNDGSIRPLDKGCTILGSFPELPFIESGEMPIDGETLIFCYTDGLTDLRNEAGETLQEASLQDFLSGHFKLPVSHFNHLLLEKLQLFKGDETFPDDLTVLTCRIKDRK